MTALPHLYPAADGHAVATSCRMSPEHHIYRGVHDSSGGLQVYESAKQLRYGHLMIMTDQDHDGSHIKGLIMNFFHHFYPTLLQLPGFLLEFITPIVKVARP